MREKSVSRMAPAVGRTMPAPLDVFVGLEVVYRLDHIREPYAREQRKLPAVRPKPAAKSPKHGLRFVTLNDKRSNKKDPPKTLSPWGAFLSLRAGDRARTGDPQLGKLMLYQLSYSRVGSKSTSGPGGVNNEAGGPVTRTARPYSTESSVVSRRSRTRSRRSPRWRRTRPRRSPPCSRRRRSHSA